MGSSGDNNDDEDEEEEDRQDNGVIKSLEAFNINYFRIETRRMKKKNNSIAPPNYSFEQGQHGYKACVDDIYAIVARVNLMNMVIHKLDHIHGETAELMIVITLILKD